MKRIIGGRPKKTIAKYKLPKVIGGDKFKDISGKASQCAL